MDENQHQITSTHQFQSLLSQDLTRVSLLYFWAPWAAPCKQMTDVVSALAGKYTAALLTLQIEADVHEEITESFEIESVPSFIVLRGHTLLARIEGAGAVALTDAITKHVGAAPFSYTEKPPAAMSESDSEAHEERLRRLMNQSTVVLFMKGSPDAPRCGFSRKICGLLRDNKISFSHFDILTDEAVRQGLKKLNDWPTYPQLIVKGEFVGGLDIVQEMVDNGELRELVA